MLLPVSGLGDDLNFVPTDKNTLRSVVLRISLFWVMRQIVPLQKQGLLHTFSSEALIGNMLEVIKGKPMTHSFDGHANCYIETGFGKASLIDFNYTTEPLPGKYPVPVIGPFSLLGNSCINHLGKLASKQCTGIFIKRPRNCL